VGIGWVLVYGREVGERWEGMGPWALVGMVFVYGGESADAGEDPRQRLRTGGAARRAWSQPLYDPPAALNNNVDFLTVKGNVFEVHYLTQSNPNEYVENRARSTSRV